MNLPSSRFLCAAAACLALVGVAGAGCSTASSSDVIQNVPDAAIPDAATLSDAAYGGDGAAIDAGGCAPSDVSGFEPQWHRATPLHQPACTDAEIDAFLAKLSGVDAGAVSQTCAECIATPDIASTYGPIVAHHGWAEANIAGCFADAMNDPTGVKCGAAMQAARACELQACAANCPVTSPSTLASFDDCAQKADYGQCASFKQDAMCADTVDGGGAELETCLAAFHASSFTEAYRAIVPLFCTGAADGGVAPSDAGADGD